MSQDYLNPDNTPQALGTTHQGKYLGKGPIVIIVLVLAAVTYAIMIAANKRSQKNVEIDRAETVTSAQTVVGNTSDNWLEQQPSGTINARRSVQINGVLQEVDVDEIGRPVLVEPNNSGLQSDGQLCAGRVRRT